MRIGFVGLGTMGQPMAGNLRKTGYAITAWDRTPSRTQHLASKGGQVAGTPRECAAGQDLVLTCVSDERALDAVLSGEDGVLAGMKRGDLLVDTSTAGVASARTVKARAEERGVLFLCAPLLGSRAAAEQAQLTIVVGGPPEARARAHPALHAMSARIIELETAEQAALMKLVVNAVGGAMMTGLAEALGLGAAGGLEVARIIETVQASAFHSPFFLMKGEQILNRDYKARFSLALAEKDQRLAQQAAEELGVKMPVNAAVRRLFADGVESGRGDQDLSSVAELVFEWAGVKR
jgi:3-hydroxyisobutyrate dehydrogenase-like beta-hydroxyacid dehydrogenase